MWYDQLTRVALPGQSRFRSFLSYFQTYCPNLISEYKNGVAMFQKSPLQAARLAKSAQLSTHTTHSEMMRIISAGRSLSNMMASEGGSKLPAR